MRGASPDRYQKSRETKIDGRQRSGIYPGAIVAIEIENEEPTGKLTEGKVVEILTVSSFHPRGIKVRLEDGSVGRVRRVGRSAGGHPGLRSG
ncbi:MAG: YwbE family protein [Methanolinea sp.]|nr:YwbE family protein [Methanolinea sp.]